MTSFVHTNFPAEHPGVVRFESAVAAAGRFRKGFDSTRSLTAMLLAAIVAALVVVADQLVDSWADGHLLAGWVILWVVAFVALALLASTARQVATSTVRALDAWSHRVAQARAEERLWTLAQKDPRVMADLQVAITRSEQDSEDVVTPVSATAHVNRQPTRTYHAYYI